MDNRIPFLARRHISPYYAYCPDCHAYTNAEHYYINQGLNRIFFCENCGKDYPHGTYLNAFPPEDSSK